jgi:hypothetical protein
MTVFIKRLFLCIIGLLGGLASWSVVESVIIFQPVFQSYLIFGSVLGMSVGLLMGGFFSSSEGIILSDRGKIWSGIVTGAISGIIGGAAGFLAGQAALFAAGNSIARSASEIDKWVLPLSRAGGWAILGIFIGLAEGIRAGSFNKIKVGFLGGLSGGIIGGLALEYLPRLIDNLPLARLTGFLVFGLMIGFFYSLLERSMSFGILRLLNGKFKGKEFLLNQRRVRIGSSGKAEISLQDYDNIAPVHAEVFSRGINVAIRNKSKESIIKVNDDVIDNQELKLDDVIQVGGAKFLFKYN